MDLDKLVKNLGLKLDDDGLCRIKADDEPLVIERSLDGEHFYLHAIVGEVSKERKAQLFALALSANLFGKETGYAFLAFDDSIQALVLIDRIPLAITNEAKLKERIANFVHYLKEWKRILATPDEELPQEFSLSSHLLGLDANQNLDIFFA